MARADPMRTTGTTKLAKLRLQKQLGQTDVARAAGLSDRTYQRLESGKLPNPGIRYLAACALALDCRLSDIIEDEWLAFGTNEPDGAARRRVAAAVHPVTGESMAGRKLPRSRL